MKCHTVICTECSTRLDGINHCAVCVARLTRAAGPIKRGSGLTLRVLSLIGLLFVLAAGSYGILHMLYLWR